MATRRLLLLLVSQALFTGCSSQPEVLAPTGEVDLCILDPKNGTLDCGNQDNVHHQLKIQDADEYICVPPEELHNLMLVH